MSGFAPALGIANAVLYEGYLLFPYTSSARKNQMRWQFGVVVPAAYAARGNGDHSEQQVEILCEADPSAGAPEVEFALRFLHVVARQIEEKTAAGFAPVAELAVDGTRHITFDEACEREVLVTLPAVDRASIEIPVAFPESTGIEELRDGGGVVRGRVVRRRAALHGSLAASCAATGIDRVVPVQTERSRREPFARAGGRRSRDRAAQRRSSRRTSCSWPPPADAFLSATDPPENAADATRTLPEPAACGRY